MPYYSSKTYTHAEGLSCCFRQWRASDSHCRFVHGYALEVKIDFVANDLDSRRWVVDFGSMKAIRVFLKSTFDHTTIVAADDPGIDRMRDLSAAGVIDLRIVPEVGCEAFAYLIYEQTRLWLRDYEKLVGAPRVFVASVEVREHSGNAARYVSSSDRGMLSSHHRLGGSSVEVRVES